MAGENPEALRASIERLVQKIERGETASGKGLIGGATQLLTKGIESGRKDWELKQAKMGPSARYNQFQERMEGGVGAVFGQGSEESTTLNKGAVTKAGMKMATGDVIGGAVELAGERKRQLEAAVKGTAVHGAKAMEAGRGVTTASEGMRSAGSALDAADPSGTASAPLKFGAKLIETGEALRQWGHALHDANRKFEEFSGSMAAVSAQKEVRDVLRMMEQGERRSSSAGNMAEALGDLEDAMAPIEDLIAIIKNEIGVFVIERLTVIAQKVSAVANWLLNLKEGEGKKQKGTDASEIFFSVSENMNKNYNKAPRF